MSAPFTTSTLFKTTTADERLVMCSSYVRKAPESPTATVGALGTRNSIDAGNCAPALAATTRNRAAKTRERMLSSFWCVIPNREPAKRAMRDLQ